MAREAISLGTEKHGKGIRYKKMFKRQFWKSKTYPQETRENKREAWQAFVLWREDQADQPATVKQDEFTLMRRVIGEKVSALLDHAELTSNPTEAAIWRDILSEVPTMDRDNLFQLTALLMGEHDGQNHTAVIEDREKTARRIKRQSDPELSARKLADEYIARLLRKAEAGQGSFGHYGQVKVALDLFVNFYGSSRSLERINEKVVRDYTANLEGLVKTGKLSRNSAHDYQQKFRTWIGQLVEEYPDDIPLPKNLRSKTQLIPTQRREPDPFTIDEVKLLLQHAVPRTRLFLLLMLNCAMYQGDIADLTADEVDWPAGRIIRPRSKTTRLAQTRGLSQPIKVNWLLWRETWRLFKKFANKDGKCFRTITGGDLITHKPTTRNDAIRPAFYRLVCKLKRHELLPANWHKTLKQFRKTGSNILEKSSKPEYAQFYNLYLNHSVAKQHYLTSGKPVPSFDQAVLWIGKQLGIKTPKKSPA
jgi:integrase